MLLKPREVADRIGVHPDTLRAWRREGRGPNYVRVGGRIGYFEHDVKGWLELSRVITSLAAK